MTAYPCNNANCPRASWCKGFTYKWPSEVTREYRLCSASDNWLYYTKNKAREIYERDNPDDILRNEEPDGQEHSDNNRESGVWENDEADTRADREGLQWRHVEPDNVLLPHGSSNPGGPGEMYNGPATAYGFTTSAEPVRTGNERRIYATDAVLQDPAFSGISSTEPGTYFPDITEELNRLLESLGIPDYVSREEHGGTGEIQRTDEG